MFFNDVITDVMFESYLVEKGLAESSIDTYTKAVEQYLKSTDKPHMMESYNKFLINVMVRSEKRGTHYYAALKHYIQFRYGREANKYIKDLLKPEIRDPKTVRQYLSKADRLKVINKLYDINYKHHIIALIQMMTGARIGDILRMQRGTISIEESNNRTMLRLDIIGKGQKKKSTYISNKYVMDAVLDFITQNTSKVETTPSIFFPVDDEEEYYFLDPKKYKTKHTLYNRMKNSARSYRLNLKLALKWSDLDEKHFSTHDWRRCFSNDNYNEFKDIVILKNVLGHSDIRTTERYLRHSGLDTRDILEKMQN